MDTIYNSFMGMEPVKELKLNYKVPIVAMDLVVVHSYENKFFDLLFLQKTDTSSDKIEKANVVAAVRCNSTTQLDYVISTIDDCYNKEATREK